MSSDAPNIETPSKAATTGGRTKPITGVTKKESHPDDNVDLIVGGCPYRTTRTVLLSSPFHDDSGETYFHALVSGRWKRTKMEQPIEIPDQDGRLFFYVLYFLQVGELPRGIGSAAHRSLLSEEDIAELESQADFFGLGRLVELCKATTDVLKGVKGSGDLDLTPYSDFSVKIEKNWVDIEETDTHANQFIFTMKYTHKGATKVLAVATGHSSDDTCEEQVCVTRCGGGDTEWVNNASFYRTMNHLTEIIKDAHAKKSSREESISVTNVLDRTDIAQEARLWYAFIVTDLIDYYERHKTFNDVIYDNGESPNDWLFFFSHTSSFNGMETVE